MKAIPMAALGSGDRCRHEEIDTMLVPCPLMLAERLSMIPGE